MDVPVGPRIDRGGQASSSRDLGDVSPARPGPARALVQNGIGDLVECKIREMRAGGARRPMGNYTTSPLRFRSMATSRRPSWLSFSSVCRPVAASHHLRPGKEDQ